jgi:hypothetical protein
MAQSNKSGRERNQRACHRQLIRNAVVSRRVNSNVGFASKVSMLKPKHTSVTLALLLFAASLPAQRSPEFSSKYVKPAAYDGLFHVQRRGGWIVIDAEDGFDPRALVLSYNNKPIEPKPNDPDAPTVPGFYLSYTVRLDFESVEVIRKAVYFKTRTVAGVNYQFNGLMGTEIIPNFEPSTRILFIKGVLTKLTNGKMMSQEDIKFVHSVIA